MESLLWWGGALFWSYAIYSVGWIIYYYLFYQGDAKHLSQHRGEWALITGASYGVGRSYALALAKRGINVIIIARSHDKLSQVAKEIETNYAGVQVKIVVADFISFREDRRLYDNIMSQLQGLTISVLVNNVGGTDGSRLAIFLDETWEDTENVRLFNTVPAEMFLKSLLPDMIKRKKGIVINVSSIASKHAYYYPSYCSGKASINQLTDLLEASYGRYGIIFQAALAGAVSTPALGEPKADGIVTVTPEVFAEASLRFLGAPKTIAAPVLGQALPVYLLDLLPRWIVWWLVESATAKLVNQKNAKEGKNK